MCHEYSEMVEKLRLALIKIRKEKKMNKKELAKRALLTPYKLAQIEKHGIIYTFDLFKIAYALEIEVHEVLRDLGY